MATYGITRVSTLVQADGTSLAEQARKIEATAIMADLTIDRMFQDAGISGAVPLSERPAGRELCALLEPGDVVIANKIDRLFRSAADAMATVKAWQDSGITLIIAAFGPSPITENGTSKLLFGILAMVADFEKEMILERTRDGREAKRAKGGHVGGDAPFGYAKEGEGKGAMLHPIPAQQAAIDAMVRLRDEGQSLRKIAAAIEDQHGFRVSHVAVRNALARRADA